MSLAFTSYITGHITESLDIYRQVFTSGYRRGDSQAQSWGLLGMVQLSLSRAGAYTRSLLSST